MAASTAAGNVVSPDAEGPASARPATGSPSLQYSMILEHLIGDKRPVKDLNPAVMGGLPLPPKTDEQKMIERGMESCAFKSLLACVGGESGFGSQATAIFYIRFYSKMSAANLSCVGVGALKRTPGLA